MNMLLSDLSDLEERRARLTMTYPIGRGPDVCRCVVRQHGVATVGVADTASCITFIDELDVLGKARGITLVAGHEEREQTLNQLLTAKQPLLEQRTRLLLEKEVLEGEELRRVIRAATDSGSRLHAGRRLHIPLIKGENNGNPTPQ